MKKLIYLLMSLSFVAFVACSEDKEKTSSKGGSSVYKSGTQDGHDYVDFGLPSGTKWATCNVGATKPEEFGNFYAWGEVEPKDNYACSTYKYSYSDCTVTKYKIGYNGDNKRVLDLEDDAAYVNWGGKWRMPTKAQLEELRSQCYVVFTYNYKGSKVLGDIYYKAKSSEDRGGFTWNEKAVSSYSYADAHIFLPWASSEEDGKAGRDGRASCWSSSTSDDERYGKDGSWAICNGSIIFRSRAEGRAVRAVIPGN